MNRLLTPLALFLLCTAAALSGTSICRAVTIAEIVPSVQILHSQVAVESNNLLVLDADIDGAINLYGGFPNVIQSLESLQSQVLLINYSLVGLQTQLVQVDTVLASLSEPVDQGVIVPVLTQVQIMHSQASVVQANISSSRAQFNSIVASVPEPSTITLAAISVMAIFIFKPRTPRRATGAARQWRRWTGPTRTGCSQRQLEDRSCGPR
jgi:hypothetical protein